MIEQSPAAKWNVYNRRCGEDSHGFYDRDGCYFREGVDPRNYYGRFLPELLDDGKWMSIDDWPSRTLQNIERFAGHGQLPEPTIYYWTMNGMKECVDDECCDNTKHYRLA